MIAIEGQMLLRINDDDDVHHTLNHSISRSPIHVNIHHVYECKSKVKENMKSVAMKEYLFSSVYNNNSY